MLSQLGLPALVRLPVPSERVGGGPGQDGRQGPAPPTPGGRTRSVVGGALLGVREGGVGRVELDELAGRPLLPPGGNHVGVEHPHQPPVCRLDLLARGSG